MWPSSPRGRSPGLPLPAMARLYQCSAHGEPLEMPINVFYRVDAENRQLSAKAVFSTQSIGVGFWLWADRCGIIAGSNSCGGLFLRVSAARVCGARYCA